MTLSNDDVFLQGIHGRPGWWRVSQPLHYEFEGQEIVVPTGFVTDLASVPRLLWWYLPPHGNYLAAAVLHDYLYGLQMLGGKEIKRVVADRVFLAAMADLGVRQLRRRIMHRGVRIGGWNAWRNKIVIRQQAA